MIQQGLFDTPPPFVRDSDTSKAAAESMKKSAHTLRAQVLDLIRKAGVAGMTCDEAEAILNLKHQTCSARFAELKKSRLIIHDGTKRPTRSGRAAKAWRVL